MKRICITLLWAALLLLAACGAPAVPEPTGEPGQPAPSPNEILEQWMEAEALTPEELGVADQLVLAVAGEADGTLGVVYCFAYDAAAEAWVCQEALSHKLAFFGRRGVSHHRIQGDETSPAGLYALPYAFGNQPEPAGLKIPWRSITPYSDWVGDQSSPYYNTWQERNDPAITQPWDDEACEHLAEYETQYAYAMTTDFNTEPVVVGKGSAIFFHCSTKATAGCIGMLEEDFLQVLRWIDAGKRPHILITGYEMTA